MIRSHRTFEIAIALAFMDITKGLFTASVSVAASVVTCKWAPLSYTGVIQTKRG